MFLFTDKVIILGVSTKKTSLFVCIWPLYPKYSSLSYKIQKFSRDFKNILALIVAIEAVTTQAKILSSALSLS